MSWTEISQKLMLDVLGILGLAVLALWLLVARPRKPKAVYAHFNKAVFNGVFLSISGSLLVMYLWAVLAIGLGLIPNTDFSENISIILVISLGLLNTIYSFYWSQPYSRKRVGVVAVDAAVERYKKPGERAVGILGGWCPDLIVGGKAYKYITYAPENGNAPNRVLVFDLQGEVVRDEQLFEKVSLCFSLAAEFVNPELINERTRIYKNSADACKAWVKMMRNYDRFEREWDASAGDKAALRKMLELGQRLSRTMMEYFEYEAGWGTERGNTHLKSVRYEEVLEVNQVWREKFGWVLSELGVFEQGIKTANKLLKAYDEVAGKSPKSREVLVLLRALLPRYKGLAKEWREWQEAGRVSDRYKVLEEEKTLWREGLAWVDVVDGWVREGYTGKALEEKKRAYLAEQERLERERKREERRRKREERKRRREMRAQKERE